MTPAKRTTPCDAENCPYGGEVEARREQHPYVVAFPAMFGILQLIIVGLTTWLCLTSIELQKGVVAFNEAQKADRREIERLSQDTQANTAEISAIRSIIAKMGGK